MATVHTDSDALTLYHSVPDEGLSQPDPKLCLGGFKSASELQGKSFFVTKSMPPIVIDAVSGKLGSGTHSIIAQTNDSVAFTAAGGTAGTTVTINNGDSVLLIDGGDDDKWVRISRISDDGLRISLDFETYDQIGNVIAQRDVTDAERTAGLTIHKAIIMESVGAVSDVRVWVSSNDLDIGIEAPVDNAIQVIASETTVPAGPIVFSSPTTEGTGLQPTPGTDGLFGIWLRIIIPAGGTGFDEINTQTLHVKFTIGGTDYFNSYTGIMRIADDSLQLFKLYESIDGAAYNFGSADTTSATLPFDHAIASPVSGTRQYSVIVRFQNEYGLESQNIFERSTTIDSAGVEQLSSITAPTSQNVSETVNGNLLATATYATGTDEDPADEWVIYVTGDGTTPDPATDTPIIIAMATTSLFSGKEQNLSHTLGPYGQGATIKVLIRARRNSDSEESPNTDIFTNTIATITPCLAYTSMTFSGNTYGHILTPPTLSGSPVTTVWDATNNIRSIITPGRHELWGDSVLIFRINYDDFDAAVNGFWTTFGIKQEVISGTGTGVVETGSWTGPDKHIFINVGGTRRMKIDVTNSLISFAALVQNPAKTWRTKSSVPIVDMGSVDTLFQVWDKGTFDYATAAHLDERGVFNLGVGWRQRQTTGEFL